MPPQAVARAAYSIPGRPAHHDRDRTRHVGLNGAVILKRPWDGGDPRPPSAARRDGPGVKCADRSCGVWLRVLVDPGDQRAFGNRDAARAKGAAIDDDSDFTGLSVGSA